MRSSAALSHPTHSYLDSSFRKSKSVALKLIIINFCVLYRINAFITFPLETQETGTTPLKSKDPTPTQLPDQGVTGNHLGVPKPADTNPNFLSPEILNQRRG